MNSYQVQIPQQNQSMKCELHEENPYIQEYTNELKAKNEDKIFHLRFLEKIIKDMVKDLLKRYENHKSLSFENHKLMMYTNDLEQCAMCIYRNKEILKGQLLRLEDEYIREDFGRTQCLNKELAKREENFKLKEQEKESLVKEYQEMEMKIKSLNERCKEIEQAKNTRDSINLGVEKIKADIQHTESRRLQQKEQLTMILDKYHQTTNKEFSNRAKNIQILEQTMEQLVIEKNGLLMSEYNHINELEETNEEKKIVLSKLEYLGELKSEMKILKLKTDRQLEECVEQMSEIYKENDSKYSQLEAYLNSEMDSCKFEKENTILDNRKLQEQSFHLQDNINISKVTICQITKEKEIIKNEKQNLEDILYDIRVNEREFFDKNQILGDRLIYINDDVTLLANILESYEWECFEIERETQKYVCKQMQQKMEHENRRCMDLQSSCFAFEKIIIDKDKEISDLDSERINFMTQYNQVLENIKNLDQIRKEKETDILYLEEELKSKDLKNENLRQTCWRLENYVTNEKDILKSAKQDSCRIYKDSQLIAQKIFPLESALGREKTVFDIYSKEMKKIKHMKTLLNEKLEELRQIESVKSQLLNKKMELEQCCSVLKVNYKSLHDCTEALLRYINNQKEIMKTQERHLEQGYTFCCNREESRNEQHMKAVRASFYCQNTSDENNMNEFTNHKYFNILISDSDDSMTNMSS